MNLRKTKDGNCWDYVAILDEKSFAEGRYCGTHANLLLFSLTKTMVIYYLRLWPSATLHTEIGFSASYRAAGKGSKITSLLVH